ncbi:HU family DNA-binding protein [Gracilimonas sp.]|uniref:HU family DNA-binding protein n=1 Tax=Gracilimonas sp. TaxID=1974203 RepID=UPI0032EBD695
MSNKVTYAEIIEALSRKTGFSKQKSEAFAKALISRVKQELDETGKASITNFGSFKVKEVAERQGQNPQTGEPITIPAHKRVSFTPYKALREDVNAKFSHLETELLGEKSKESTTAVPVSREEKPQEPEEEKKDTIFQFDDEPEEEIEEQEEKAEEFQAEETVEEQEPQEDPFAFDETESTSEKEEEPEPVSREPFVREEKKEKSNNFALILVIAALLAVALVPVWWFFLRTEPTNMPTQQARVEQPRTPQASNDRPSGSGEAKEPVQANNESANTQTPAKKEPPAASSSAGIEEKETSGSSSEITTTTYTVKKDEWYWVIAKKVYGKSQFWPLIYQANFTMDTHPDSLKNNRSLKVPALQGSASSPSKMDYQRLAEASQMVSDSYRKFGRNDKAEEYARFAKKWQGLGN